mmetsp:Transcript_9047/g.33267  ORF Transcript_9047/g.33267 Transcript_9047/m.33267 type:complete len:217 (-) Transcript_9047:634-1284(-)
MGILYACVARGKVILVEQAEGDGNNAGAVVRRILESLPQKDNKVSYTHDRHIFHLLVVDGFTYVCVAAEELGRGIPFAFLEETKTRFTSTYGEAAETALAFAYNDEFGRVLGQQMDYFSNNPQADTITRVRGEISEVKEVMVQNIEKVLDRGEKIELLVDKTDQLQGDAFRFKRRGIQLKRQMWWKNIKLIVRDHVHRLNEHGVESAVEWELARSF